MVSTMQDVGCAFRRLGRTPGFPALAAAALAAGLAMGVDGQPAFPGTSGTAELDELLRLHHAHRVAHVTGDADALTATFADPVLDVGGGRVTRRTRADAARRFEAYFAASTFIEWEDVRPPVVQLSRDRTMAVVHVEKRVRVLSRGPDGDGAGSAERFAWTEAWRREAERWTLASTTSTRGAEPDPFTATPEARREAARVLRLAREALGGEVPVAGVAMISFQADCEGPRGPFRTRVISARDGRVRFEQDFPDRPGFGIGTGLDGDWRRPHRDDRGALSAEERSVVHAHEMPLLALAPEARYRAPFASGTAEFHGRTAAIVRFADALDAPVDVFYDVELRHPLGLRLRNHTGRGAERIEVRYDDWRSVGDVRLPFAMTITQGEEIYRYRITSMDTRWVAAGGFEPS